MGAMTAVARRYVEEAKAKDTDQEVAFLIATESDRLTTQIRPDLGMANVADKPEQPARLMLVDIPSDGAYYEGPEGEITSDVVQKLIADWKDNKLTKKTLGQ